MLQEHEKIAVHWKGLDVLLFLAIWFTAQHSVLGIVAGYVAAPLQPPEPAATVDKTDHGHPVLQMLEQGKNSPVVILVAFLTVVVATPLIEEFLFRLLFQGWLETQFGASGTAIVVVSFCFAVLHGGNSKPLAEQMLFYVFAAMTVTNLLIFSLGIIYLERVRNVKMTRCLFGSGRFFSPQFFTYAGCWLLTLIPIIGTAAFLDIICPNINTDPIPIFLFSLVLGILYRMTRNLAYCILLHACLNLTSLIIAWLTV